MNEKKIKVLIVEDSLVAQKLLAGLIRNDQRFELVGIAENGIQANKYVAELKPDVVSMDIIMPFMDGIEATRKIMQENPVPVVIVSSFSVSTEVEMAIKVLEVGAVSLLPKPFGPGDPSHLKSSRRYLNTLKLMSEVRVVRRKKEASSIKENNKTPLIAYLENISIKQKYKILAIGASAGGPQSLSTIISNLPENFPIPIVIVQHIDNHFADGFATWLNSNSKLLVSVAKNGEKLKPGHIYLPPGDYHLTIKRNDIISIDKDPQIKGLRPSIDKLFKSVSDIYGKESIAVLLSGMGKDGATEMKTLFDKGAFTIAQDEASCLVFGMPGEAVKLGAVCKLLSPEKITKEILDLINK